MPPTVDLVEATRRGVAPGGAKLSEGLIRVLRDALDSVRVAVRRFGCPCLATAFNGGKDATVVLHIVRAAIAAEGGGDVCCMYLLEDHAFEEVDQFVRDTAQSLGVNAVEQGGGFKAGIKQFVEGRGVHAFVMGTRRTDPDATGMVAFMPSSPGWPTFMRVNPILDWTYGHVWEFLRAFEIPYCGLYDRGYTSIGNVHNTDPNPELSLTDLDGNVSYRPAWELADPTLERAGRLSGPRRVDN